MKVFIKTAVILSSLLFAMSARADVFVAAGTYVAPGYQWVAAVNTPGIHIQILKRNGVEVARKLDASYYVVGCFLSASVSDHRVQGGATGKPCAQDNTWGVLRIE